MTHQLKASNLSQATATIVPCSANGLSLTEQDIASFAKRPLSPIEFDKWICEVRTEDSKTEALDGIPFAKIQQHSNAGDVVAKDVLRRTEEDMATYKRQEEEKGRVSYHLKGLSTAEVLALVAGSNTSAGQHKMDAATSNLRDAAAAVSRVRQESVALVSEAIDLILAQVNTIESASLDIEQVRFRLRRFKDDIPHISIAFLIETLLSTEGVADIKRLNPHCADTTHLMQLLLAVLLHSNRIAHASRALTSLHGLTHTLTQLKAKKQVPVCVQLASGESVCETCGARG